MIKETLPACCDESNPYYKYIHEEWIEEYTKNIKEPLYELAEAAIDLIIIRERARKINDQIIINECTKGLKEIHQHWLDTFDPFNNFGYD